MRITEENKDKFADMPENYVGPEFEDIPISGSNWQIRAEARFDHNEIEEEEDWIEPADSHYFLKKIYLIEFHPFDRPFRENIVFLILIIAENDTEDVAKINDLLAILYDYDNALAQFHSYVQQALEFEFSGERVFRLKHINVTDKPAFIYYSEEEYRAKFPEEYAKLMEKHPYKSIISSAGDDLMDWSEVPIVKEEGDKAFIPIIPFKKVDASSKLETFEDLEQEIKRILEKYELDKSNKEAKMKALRELVILIQDIPRLSSFEKEKQRQAIAVINKALLEIVSKKYEYPVLTTDAQKWYVLDMRVMKKADLTGQFTGAQIKAIPFQKLKGAWIAQSWVWERYPLKIVDKLPTEAKLEPVSVLAIDYGYVFKMDLPDVHYINEGLLYIEPGAYLDIKASLRNQNNLIYTDQTYHAYRQNITRARMEALKVTAGTDARTRILTEEEIEKRKQVDGLFEYLDEHAKSFVEEKFSPEIVTKINAEIKTNLISEEEFRMIFDRWQNPPFPFSFCKACRQFGILAEENRENEYDKIRPEVCQYFESDSFRPDSCPLGFISNIQDTIIDEQDAQRKYAELALYLKNAKHAKQSEEVLFIASQENDHEKKFIEILAEFNKISAQNDSVPKLEGLSKKIAISLGEAIFDEIDAQKNYSKFIISLEQYGLERFIPDIQAIIKQESEHEGKFKQMQETLHAPFPESDSGTKKDSIKPKQSTASKKKESKKQYEIYPASIWDNEGEYLIDPKEKSLPETYSDLSQGIQKSRETLTEKYSDLVKFIQDHCFVILVTDRETGNELEDRLYLDGISGKTFEFGTDLIKYLMKTYKVKF